MSASFDRIDYSVRPAKYAERRMLRDLFRRLSAFQSPEDYTYIGFGSVWFSDFILFHRSLGVRKMVSIESKTKAFQRIEDNAPYKIKLCFERASSALPKLDWGPRSFVWLDYDRQLSAEALLDIRSVTANARSGSVLAVSFRADEAHEAAVDQDAEGAQQKTALARFVEAFTTARVPPDTSEEDLFGKPFSRLTRAMVLAEIEQALGVRNRRLQDKMSFRPICSIDYADGVEMTTLVGLYVADSEAALADRCQFETLDFTKADPTEPISITIPKLTIREFRLLEAQLPLPNGAALSLGTIPASEAETFHEFYRYLPNFVVAES